MKLTNTFGLQMRIFAWDHWRFSFIVEGITQAELQADACLTRLAEQLAFHFFDQIISAVTIYWQMNRNQSVVSFPDLIWSILGLGPRLAASEWRWPSLVKWWTHKEMRRLGVGLLPGLASSWCKSWPQIFSCLPFLESLQRLLYLADVLEEYIGTKQLWWTHIDLHSPLAYAAEETCLCNNNQISTSVCTINLFPWQHTLRWV